MHPERGLDFHRVAGDETTMGLAEHGTALYDHYARNH